MLGLLLWCFSFHGNYTAENYTADKVANIL